MSNVRHFYMYIIEVLHTNEYQTQPTVGVSDFSIMIDSIEPNRLWSQIYIHVSLDLTMESISNHLNKSSVNRELTFEFEWISFFVR